MSDAGLVEHEIEVAYRPRSFMKPLHASDKRWIFMCCHRRAGKTVGIANHLIRAASRNPRKWPPPRYGYVGPSFDQAKDLVWGYLKQYTEAIPGVVHLEGELKTILPSGASIKLYGGAGAYQRMRGMYFDGIALDEFPLLEPTVFGTVVRPCLADYRGWAIVSGTSNGDDHFNALRLKAEDDPSRWDVLIIPLSSTGEEALSYSEAEELVKDMTPEEYAREMECSFDAPVEGAYYAEILNQLASQGRICKVPVDLSQPVITAWDLGIHDYTCIWLYQVAGREVHFVDYIQDNNKDLGHYTDLLRLKARAGGYKFKAHCLPHDVEARELQTGQSRRAFLENELDEVIITAPMASPEDGIAASRGLLGVSWFDATNTKKGLAMLRGYRKNKMGKPVHGPGPHSHGADAYRTFATAFHLVGGYRSRRLGQGALRRKIRGLV
jgi:phage terminase large subunit